MLYAHNVRIAPSERATRLSVALKTRKHAAGKWSNAYGQRMMGDPAHVSSYYLKPDVFLLSFVAGGSFDGVLGFEVKNKKRTVPLDAR